MMRPRHFPGLLGAIRVCLAAAAFAGCVDSGAASGQGVSAGRSAGGSTGADATHGVTGSGNTSSTDGSTGLGGTGSVTGPGRVSDSSGLSSAGGTTGLGATSASGSTGGGGGSTGLDGGASDAAGTPISCPAATPLTGGKQYCSNSKGTADGNYSYELWSNGTGSGCMTVYGVDANFAATWSSVGDFLARIGLGFDESTLAAKIGTISSDFAETKTSESGLVYVGIYGWTVNPLREYYIIDDWGSTKPAGVASDGTARTMVGTISVDGDMYDVWKHTQMNKPAITGNNQTFDQYFSIRRTARQCGHISISEHFSQWIGLGLQLGDLEEAKLLVEAQNNSGSINFTTATVVVQ
jgi:hypothetical protein